ncbi:hypothetical protein BKA62DRAFT_814164 [Auriculariales sp. MPI-PUGE-AT-0066]|nr:hypothetical protein BKA62DRAFT_814164 [Auriculariales sp. MPI-PUGE-AT-0066]
MSSTSTADLGHSTPVSESQGSSLEPQLSFDSAEAFGPWFVGSAMDLVLLGLIIALVIEYWRSSAVTDRCRVKALATASGFLSLLRSISVQATLWHKLVTGWGNVLMAETSTPWYAAIDPIFNGAGPAALVEIMRLMQRGTKIVWDTPGSAMELADHDDLTVHACETVQIFQIRAHVAVELAKNAELAANIGKISSDVLITASLCFSLFKSRVGIARTDGVLIKLIHLTWATALLPTICAIITVSLYFRYLLKSSSWITFDLMESKLYTLSMLITLNMRNVIRGSQVEPTPNLHTFELRDTRTGISGSRNDVHETDSKVSDVEITVFRRGQPEVRRGNDGNRRCPFPPHSSHHDGTEEAMHEELWASQSGKTKIGTIA